MANFNGSLEAVDCIFTAWDTLWCKSSARSRPNWASSGNLRRCSDADTSNKCLSRVKDASILSWPTFIRH
eukprot:scaffold11849_cov105-Skeletonema_dohrnii-CCMP3373.AAC.1